jgi:hypothetical protein
MLVVWTRALRLADPSVEERHRVRSRGIDSIRTKGHHGHVERCADQWNKGLQGSGAIPIVALPSRECARCCVAVCCTGAYSSEVARGHLFCPCTVSASADARLHPLGEYGIDYHGVGFRACRGGQSGAWRKVAEHRLRRRRSRCRPGQRVEGLAPGVDNPDIGRWLPKHSSTRSPGTCASKSKRARVAIGGSFPRGLDGGYFLEPTIFTDVEDSMRIAQEEIFGPVLCAIKFGGEDEAVRIANDTQYGLVAVWTRDLSRASRSGTYRLQSGVRQRILHGGIETRSAATRPATSDARRDSRHSAATHRSRR